MYLEQPIPSCAAVPLDLKDKKDFVTGRTSGQERRRRPARETAVSDENHDDDDDYNDDDVDYDDDNGDHQSKRVPIGEPFSLPLGQFHNSGD